MLLKHRTLVFEDKRMKIFKLKGRLRIGGFGW
jgi:hypothetical protein